MSFIGYMYALFGWAGNLFTKVYKGLYDDIITADLRIYPPAYASLVAALTLITFFIGLGSGSFILAASLLHMVPFLSVISGVMLSTIMMFLIPGLVFLFGISYPKIKKVSRASNASCRR